MPCRPAISSLSLGLPAVHPLAPRLDQASRYGLDIELFHDDVLETAHSLTGTGTMTDPEKQIRAATVIRSLCDERGIKIVCLQPFRHYEGLLDRAEHDRRVEEMRLWIRLVQVLGTDLIGIPSNFLPAAQASGDRDLIVHDLREIADLGAPSGVRFTYEALAWGTHVSTWEACWDVVKAVDRDNFGICLDTFNVAGRVYADPAAALGVAVDGGSSMAASLARLKDRIEVKKLFWVQVVDAERLQSPLNEEHPYHVDGQPARMSWSRNCRLFYGEQERGAYLPIKAVLSVIMTDLGWLGCMSAELFNRTLASTEPATPKEHAERAAKSFRKLASDFGLEMQK
ncbi:3-dehydroshikimate dehydratase [Xylariales sp. AK1849]|nr:3-dehydroshikimate dehydratase [Xylariales sp. AK1849]